MRNIFFTYFDIVSVGIVPKWLIFYSSWKNNIYGMEGGSLLSIFISDRKSMAELRLGVLDKTFLVT